MLGSKGTCNAHIYINEVLLYGTVETVMGPTAAWGGVLAYGHAAKHDELQYLSSLRLLLKMQYSMCTE